MTKSFLSGKHLRDSGDTPQQPKRSYIRTMCEGSLGPRSGGIVYWISLLALRLARRQIGSSYEAKESDTVKPDSH
jgi:hypothetical protein